jgi:DNA-binding transcriptional ArsR family regulator
VPVPDREGEAGDQDPEVAVFAALADSTRRSLLDHLSSEGPLTATQLSGRYQVSRQAVTKHLAALSAAGLVRTERRGREVFYGISPGSLRAATSWLDTVGQRWDRRLDALQHALEDPPGRSSA